MKTLIRAFFDSATVAAFLTVVSCGAGDDALPTASNDVAPGNGGAGGTTAQGGNHTSGTGGGSAIGGAGGSNATGGSTASGGGAGSGGTNANAGSTASGGTTANGGSTANGGATTNGGNGGSGAVGMPSAIGPPPVLLGSASHYAILAKAAVSNVPTSAVTGSIGLSPAAASYVTGFALTNAGTEWTSPQVVGGIFAADNDPPTPTLLTTAIGDMETAYTDAAGRADPTFLDLQGGAIGGLTLAPGLYKWNSSVSIASDLAIAGAPDDTWIFQISGDLTMAAAKGMTLGGGAQAKNVVWQVAGFVDLGSTAHAEGIVLSKTAITLETGSSINGRLLAQTAVSLDSSTVTEPLNAKRTQDDAR